MTIGKMQEEQWQQRRVAKLVAVTHVDIVIGERPNVSQLSLLIASLMSTKNSYETSFK
jgi:hypothetical protein